MMSFNPATFNPLLSTTQPSTPIKTDSSSSVNGSSPSGAEDMLRYLASLSAAANAPQGNSPMAGLFPPFALGGAPTPAGLPFPFLMQTDIKPEMLVGATGGGPIMPFLDFGGYHPYGLDGVRRKNATRETTAPLKHWLSDHRKNPYPNKAEKVMLSMVTKMTLTQVSTWFANARRRLKKENKMTWSPRNRTNDDDDDMADLERPGSSKSDVSDEHNESNNNENNDGAVTSSPQPSSEDSPRKAKIWSIADTVGVKEEDEEAGSSKKDSSSTSDNNPAFAMAAVWQQQQLAAMQLARLMSSGVPGLPSAPLNPSPAGALNPAMLNQYLMASMMQARLAAAQQTTVGGTSNGSAEAAPFSSLSPSSSTHSDNDKPPTLVDATASPFRCKKESPEPN